jgi:hypothetical protein
MTPKIYPPYGRQLDKIRKNGMIPDKRIIVTTRWELGEAYPRIVIPDDVSVEKYNFSYLSGLGVQIVHLNNETQLVSNLVHEILKVKPGVLTTFNYELAKNNLSDHPATRRIYSESAEVA